MNVTRAVLPVMRAQRAGLSWRFLDRRHCRPGVLHRLCRFQVRGRGLDRVACPRGRSVRDPHDAGRAGLFRTELLSPESTNYAEASIDDYAERTTQTVAAWNAMNGQQGGDPAKRATALVQLASRDEPPRRFVAGVDAGATVEQKAKDLLARPTPTASCPATSPTTTPELTADRNPAGQPAPTQVPARAGQRRGEGAERTLASRDASAGRLATWRDRMGSRTAPAGATRHATGEVTPPPPALGRPSREEEHRMELNLTGTAALVTGASSASAPPPPASSPSTVPASRWWPAAGTVWKPSPPRSTRRAAPRWSWKPTSPTPPRPRRPSSRPSSNSDGWTPWSTTLA